MRAALRESLRELARMRERESQRIIEVSDLDQLQTQKQKILAQLAQERKRVSRLTRQIDSSSIQQERMHQMQSHYEKRLRSQQQRLEHL